MINIPLSIFIIQTYNAAVHLAQGTFIGRLAEYRAFTQIQELFKSPEPCDQVQPPCYILAFV
jgi:hypothetical protein